MIKSFYLPLKLAFKLFLRDWRAGEIHVFLLALILAVSAVSSVSFLNERIGKAIQQDTKKMLAADLLIQSDERIDKELLKLASKHDLKTALTAEFRSMLMLDNDSVLVSVKAVDNQYPLKGQLKVLGIEKGLNQGPTNNHAWIDTALSERLAIDKGGLIQLGHLELEVSEVLTEEPDRGFQLAQLAPRLMIDWDDLKDTGLEVPGSRIQYKFLLSGHESNLKQFKKEAEGSLKSGQQFITFDELQPQIKASLDRAHSFLALISLLTVLIAGIAIVLVSARFYKRHKNGIAVIKSFGYSQSFLRQVLLLEFFYIAVIGTVIALFIGYFSHLFLVQMIQSFFESKLPSFTLTPVIKSFALGILFVFTCAFNSFWYLSQANPLSIFQQQKSNVNLTQSKKYLYSFIILFCLMWWFSNDLYLTALASLGIVCAFFIFVFCSYLFISLLRQLKKRNLNKPFLSLALAGISNRPMMVITQISALAFGVMIILLLLFIRSDLLNSWKDTIAEDAPNHFLINVQDHQKEEIEKFLIQHGLKDINFDPMIRGRLSKINNQSINLDDYENQRAQRLLQREFNLSYQQDLPEGNKLVNGYWINQKKPEISFEIELAELLKINIGDQLTFEVSGHEVEAKVVNFREVKWDSMQVNFFAIMSATLLENQPRSWITSFHLPPENLSLTHSLVKKYPNVTIFNVSQIIKQLENVVYKMSSIVQFLFVFTFLAALLVLFSAFLANYDERLYESALLRSMGATLKQLQWIQRFELLFIGVVAGVLACFLGVFTTHLIAELIFEFKFNWSWSSILLMMLLSMLTTFIGGFFALRQVRNHSALQILNARYE